MMKINGIPLPQGWSLKEFFDKVNNPIDDTFYNIMANPNLDENSRLMVFEDRLNNPIYNPELINANTKSSDIITMINNATNGYNPDRLTKILEDNAIAYGKPLHSFIGTKNTAENIYNNYMDSGVETPEIKNIKKLLSGPFNFYNDYFPF